MFLNYDQIDTSELGNRFLWCSQIISNTTTAIIVGVTWLSEVIFLFTLNQTIINCLNSCTYPKAEKKSGLNSQWTVVGLSAVVLLPLSLLLSTLASCLNNLSKSCWLFVLLLLPSFKWYAWVTPWNWALNDSLLLFHPISFLNLLPNPLLWSLLVFATFTLDQSLKKMNWTQKNVSLQSVIVIFFYLVLTEGKNA